MESLILKDVETNELSNKFIIDLLAIEEKEWSVKEIKENLGKSNQAINNLLGRLIEDGYVERLKRGKYKIKNNYTITQPLKDDLIV